MRDVGLLEQHVPRRPGHGLVRDADARLDADRQLVREDRGVQHSATRGRRDESRPARRSGSRTANSSPPRRATSVPSSGSAARPAPTPEQQVVTDVVTEGVVDLLELVEVQQHDGESLVLGLGKLDLPFDKGTEPGAVGQPGELVGDRQPAQRLTAIL